MDQGLIITYGIKLVLGGITAFLAILLKTKTRASGWLCLAVSVITNYVGIIYQMMKDLGLMNELSWEFMGLDIVHLCITVIPFGFMAAALILFIRDLN